MNTGLGPSTRDSLAACVLQQVQLAVVLSRPAACNDRPSVRGKAAGAVCTPARAGPRAADTRLGVGSATGGPLSEELSSSSELEDVPSTRLFLNARLSPSGRPRAAPLASTAAGDSGGGNAAPSAHTLHLPPSCAGALHSGDTATWSSTWQVDVSPGTNSLTCTCGCTHFTNADAAVTKAAVPGGPMSSTRPCPSAASRSRRAGKPACGGQTNQSRVSQLWCQWAQRRGSHAPLLRVPGESGPRRTACPWAARGAPRPVEQSLQAR